MKGIPTVKVWSEYNFCEWKTVLNFNSINLSWWNIWACLSVGGTKVPIHLLERGNVYGSIIYVNYYCIHHKLERIATFVNICWNYRLEILLKMNPEGTMPGYTNSVHNNRAEAAEELNAFNTRFLRKYWQCFLAHSSNMFSECLDLQYWGIRVTVFSMYFYIASVYFVIRMWEIPLMSHHLLMGHLSFKNVIL